MSRERLVVRSGALDEAHPVAQKSNAASVPTGNTAAMAVLRPTTDGLVTIRPVAPSEVAVLVSGRDEAFHRWLGPGTAAPDPVACIDAAGEVVGWVDYDSDRAWLQPGEVNLGYHVFSAHGGRGFGTRAVQLLMHHLAVSTDHRAATLLIDRDNERSLALASRTGFTPCGERAGQRSFRRAVPPLAYHDATVTIRRQRVHDLDADLQAKDDEQIDWMWLPGQRETWTAMTETEQRSHARRGLQAGHDAFGCGPKWAFSVDTAAATCVAYVDCDLANDHGPPGEANISYSAHPAHRGQGHVSRAVRLVTRFLAEHTGAREGHIIVDEDNLPSLRVAAAVGACPSERWTNEIGRTMIRHIVPLRTTSRGVAQ
jgi:RimJ/RimL family protein N-acetyltransferase